MSAAESSQVANELLQERSREALIEGLGAAIEDLGTDDLLTFMADLLLTSAADRDYLKNRLASLLATQFGRRSEKADPAQLALFAKLMQVVADTEANEGSGTNADEQAEAAAEAARILEQTNQEIAALVVKKREQRKADREARRAATKLEQATGEQQVRWPTHLPVREEVLEVSDADKDCDDCGEERRVIRHETTWRLEYTTNAEVVVTHLPVVACGSHHGGPVTAPVPPKPVDKGRMGFTLAARILWLRVTHNLPVARIAEMMRADGVPVTESMIHTLISTSGERAKPLVAALQQAVQSATLVNLDDTPVDVYVGHRERKRHRARVWLALGDERFAYFFATKSWKMADAEKALGPITGVLQGDGYKGFPTYAKLHDVTLAGCLAHLRRKLQKAQKAHDPRANWPMALVQGLYRVEELARLQDLDPDGRLALRQERSMPMMLALVTWAKQVEPTIATGSPLGKAWTYLSNQLVALQTFLTNGAVSIDNNAAERGLRRITIGRKLWLFFRGQAKLEHVARLMSITYTARLQGVDELAYIAWVLEQLARREWSPEAARQLLPGAWLALNKQQMEEGGADEG